MQNKKVLVFLAKAFETMEFCVFIDILGWAEDTETVKKAMGF